MNRRKLKTNFALNIVGMGLPVLTGLVTVPLYIANIGTARFGVLAIVWILLGYFGFFDLGLSRASANALAKLADAPRNKRVRVLMTSFYLSLFLGLTGGLILYFIGEALIRRVLTLDEPIVSEVSTAFFWIAGMLPLALIAGMCRGAIESKERFLAANFVDVAGYVAGQILPLLAAIFIAPTLPVVLAAAFGARAGSVFLALGYVLLTERVNTFRVFDRQSVSEFMGYGAWVSVTNVIGPALMFLDQLFVGSVLGATAVAHYAVPMNLVTRSQIIAAALARAIFPRFSRMNREKAIDLGESAAVTLGFVYGAICAPAIIMSKLFMDLWIGLEFSSEAAPILALLLMGAWINGIAFIPYGFLQGQRRPQVAAAAHAAEIIPYILLLWFMLSKFGVIGAAIAWNLRVAIDAVILLKLAGFRNRNMIGLLLGFILILISYATNIALAARSAIWSVSVASLFFLIVVGFAAALDKNIRRIILDLWRRKPS